MVWYNLKIGSFQVKITPLNAEAKEYPYCDSQGNELKRVSGKFEKGHFINEKTGEKHDTAFRLINGKPYAKLKKTDNITNYKEVERIDVDDLLIEKTYLVECDSLLNELRETGKALLFGYCAGNGFKVYKAYIHTSDLYKGLLFMSCGLVRKSDLIQQIAEVQKQKQKAEQITATIQGIERARVEDLIQI